MSSSSTQIMACRSVQILCLVSVYAVTAEARLLASQPQKGGDSMLKEIQVDQTSNSKTHPLVDDKKPKVDVLHFKHPYPVVQDSGDFDKDYVQDQNRDNGSFMAQQEYDRLRHLLLKYKTEVPVALAKMQKEEADVSESKKQMQKEIGEETWEIAKKQAEVAKKIADDANADAKEKAKIEALTEDLETAKAQLEKHEEKHEQVKAMPKHEPEQVPEPTPYPEPTEAPVEKKEEEKKEEKKEKPAKPWTICDWLPFVWGCKEETPEPKAAPAPEPEDPTKPKVKGISDAKASITAATAQHAHCQKELDEAKEKLNELMAKLETEKAEHIKAQKAKVEALTEQHSDEKHEAKMHEDYLQESKGFAAAKKAYEKQQERIVQLKRQLKFASAGVKDMRDAEDSTGGVYNTPNKSFAKLMSASPLLAIFAAVAACY